MIHTGEKAVEKIVADAEEESNWRADRYADFIATQAKQNEKKLGERITKAEEEVVHRMHDIETNEREKNWK